MRRNRAQSVENGLHGLLGMVVGEGPIVGSECQREGNGLLAVGNVRACVDIKQRAALEILPPALLMQSMSFATGIDLSQTTAISRVTAGTSAEACISDRGRRHSAAFPAKARRSKARCQRRSFAATSEDGSGRIRRCTHRLPKALAQRRVVRGIVCACLEADASARRSFIIASTRPFYGEEVDLRAVGAEGEVLFSRSQGRPYRRGGRFCPAHRA